MGLEPRTLRMASSLVRRAWRDRETTGTKVKPYISRYWDGMLVLDVTDPHNPEEIARYFDSSPGSLESNGGFPHAFWGVGKEANRPWIYGSDRNGGLYVFKEQGAGSG